MDGEASVKKDWLKQPGLVDSDRLANQSLVGCQTTIQESSNQFESGCFLCGEGSEMNPDQSSVLSNSTNIAYAPPSSSQSAPGFVSSSNTTAAPTAQLLNEDALRLLLWLRGEMIKQTERLTSVVDNFTQIRMDVDYLLRGGTIEPIADYNETLLRNFPLKSVAELDKVEEELLNAAYRRKLFEELRVLGGRDLQDVTRTILRRLFTNGLVKLYNWTGVKNKRPLSQLRLARFIIGSVLRIVPNCTQHDVKTQITRWWANVTVRVLHDAVKSLQVNKSNLYNIYIFLFASTTFIQV